MVTATAEQTKRYQIVNGTSYDERTPAEVVRILEERRHDGGRIFIHYGDTETGRDWLEENDVCGRIARSTGPVKIPLLITGRELGGPGILDHCIVKITTATTDRKTLYVHQNYNHGAVTTIQAVETFGRKTYRSIVLIDGLVHARFPSVDGAEKWVRKMGLSR